MQPVLIVDFYHTGCQVELVVLFFGIETVIGIEMMMNLHHRLLQRKSGWKPSEIGVIKHVSWSSSRRIPPIPVMWWSAFRTSSSSSHQYSDVPLSPLKLMIGSVPSIVSLTLHMLLPMTELSSRYTSWKVLLFNGGRTMLLCSQMVT